MSKNKSIITLLESVKISKNYVVCNFRCSISKKLLVSTVPFEPYNGKIKITIKDIIFSPIKSYYRYYHTPITIYADECEDTIVLKAFEQISQYFIWNEDEKIYIYKKEENEKRDNPSSKSYT